MNIDESRMTGNDRLAAEAIRLKKETVYPFSKFAADHNIRKTVFMACLTVIA